LARDRRIFEDLWPEFNLHGDHTATYFGALFPTYAHLQVLFVDRRADRVVARGRTIALRWDGTLQDLPPGIDAAGLRALDEPDKVTALSALSAEVDRAYQGQHLSGLVLRAMGDVARSAGLAPLLAPVRPSWKDRYPLIPIEQYAGWHDESGFPFDPWMRVHTRLGARIVRVEARSLQISAPASEWETWTKMSFPDDGQYVFPGGLAPMTVNRGIGTYFEPNVWMLHEL